MSSRSSSRTARVIHRDLVWGVGSFILSQREQTTLPETLNHGKMPQIGKLASRTNEKLDGGEADHRQGVNTNVGYSWIPPRKQKTEVSPSNNQGNKHFIKDSAKRTVRHSKITPDTCYQENLSDSNRELERTWNCERV